MADRIDKDINKLANAIKDISEFNKDKSYKARYTKFITEKETEFKTKYGEKEYFNYMADYMEKRGDLDFEMMLSLEKSIKNYGKEIGKNIYDIKYSQIQKEDALNKYLEEQREIMIRDYGQGEGEKLYEKNKQKFTKEFMNILLKEKLLQKYGEIGSKRMFEKINKDYFKEARDNFNDFFSGILDATGFGTIFRTIFGAVDTFLFKPLQGMFNMGRGLLGIGSDNVREELLKQEQANKNLTLNEEQLLALNTIVDNTSPKQEMIKGGALDKLKGLFGTGASAISKFAKMFGVGLILGGIIWMVKDFIDGYMEGGLSGGLIKAFLGEAEGGIMSTLKNAGKYALIGGGIGMMVGGPLGGIIGGLAGAAIGGLLNATLQLIKGPGTGGQKVGKAIFGGVGGPMSTLFSGMKWASMGFLIGLPFGGPIGGLIGAGIGFVLGSLVNIVWQVLGKDGRKAVTQFFDKAVEWFGMAWDSIKGFFSKIGPMVDDIIKSIPIFGTLYKIYREYIIEPVFGFFKSVGTWMKEKFTGWWNAADEEEQKIPKQKKKAANLLGIGGSPDIGYMDKKEIKESKKRAVKQEKEQKDTHKTIKGMKGSMKYWLKKIFIFLDRDMSSKISDVLEKNLNDLFLKFDALNMENRMWDEFKAGVSTTDFMSKYEDFNERMLKLTTKEKKQLAQTQLTNMDNRTNIVNNVTTNSKLTLKKKY